MRILAIDPGAERCGWALLEDGPTYIDSGILGLPRQGADFQLYRLELDIWYHGLFSALIAGGQMNLDHLKKVKLDVHLTLLRQLAPPKIPFLGTSIGAVANHTFAKL